MTVSFRRLVLWLIPVVLLGLFLIPSSLSSPPASPAGTALAAGKAPTAARAATDLSHVSLAFEPNHGQAPSSVRYLAHGPGYTLDLTASGARMVLTQEAAKVPSRPTMPNPVQHPMATAAPARTRSATVGLLPVGMGSHVRITVSDKLPGIVNYFIGNKPSQWHTNIPTYGRVTYHNVYPHIDLVFYGSGSRPEYDWVVRPGGNLALIRLQVTGAGTVAGKHGQLRMETGLGPLVQAAPHIVQAGGHTIRGGYTLRGNNILGIHISHYDRTKPLVIDPVLALDYSTFLPGEPVAVTYPPPMPGDGGSAIAVDSAGDAYIVQTTTDSVAAVTRLNQDASQVLYTAYLGGLDRTGHNFAENPDVPAITVDSVGDAYVVGEAGPDFPVCGSSPTCTSPGTAIEPTFHSGTGGEAFVTKLDPSGSKLVYSTYLGGSTYSRAIGVGVDGAGNAYVTGETADSDFPVCGPFPKCRYFWSFIQSTYGGGGSDVFVSKINPTGTRLLYSTYLGGIAVDTPAGIAVDAAGDAYLTGYTDPAYYTPRAELYPVCPGPRCAVPGNEIQPLPSGRGDIFVTKLNPLGTQFLYSTFFGGNNQDVPTGIAIDSAGDAYITGYTISMDFPTCGSYAKCATPGIALQPTITADAPDGFVTKFSPDASQLLYSTYLGADWLDYPKGIAVDGTGEAVITGWTASNNWPVCGINAECEAQSTFLEGNPGLADYAQSFSPFLTILDAAGSRIVYSTFLWMEGVDGVAADAAGSVYFTGSGSGFQYPVCGETSLCITSHPPLQSYWSGSYGAFVSKLEYEPSAPPLPKVFADVGCCAGNNGWFNVGNVKVDWLFSVPQPPVTGETGCTPTTIRADTPGIALTCTVMSAGGTGWSSVTIRRDTVAPSIKLTSVTGGPPVTGTITIQDALSGVDSIDVVKQSNCTVAGTTSFVSGTTAPVQITAARQNDKTVCDLTIRATDVAGNFTTFDPAILLSSVGPQSPATDRLADVAGTDSQVTVVNGTPGLQTLMILVNGHLFPLTHLQNGETRVVDVSSAMHTGNTNSVIVLGTGEPGASAAVLLGPPSGSS